MSKLKWVGDNSLSAAKKYIKIIFPTNKTIWKYCAQTLYRLCINGTDIRNVDALQCVSTDIRDVYKISGA